jgi:hypothetical protein
MHKTALDLGIEETARRCVERMAMMLDSGTHTRSGRGLIGVFAGPFVVGSLVFGAIRHLLAPREAAERSYG